MVFKSPPPPPPPAILYILHYCAQKRGVAGLILTLPKSHCSMCHSMSTHESRFHLNFAVSSNPNQTKRSRALASAREHLQHYHRSLMAHICTNQEKLFISSNLAKIERHAEQMS
ncbi:hypothetical protein T09_6283 [Trichinella sp. T9]|nr:hypothetical protein T09_6283 [Trichinella sp. T9]